ncbi:MAG: hypothetical protein U1C49_02475 [Candidatus Andersenbacteria bacterium]|nr:hypothetical protein [bacterium]MDZ4225693.1 hypothetical protein [Candidatus Andersenbacteria bacterium]
MISARQLVLIVLLLTAILLPRVFNLDVFRTPDEDRWISRTASFTRELSFGRLDRLLWSPTPGTTTHWLGALTVRFNDWQTKKLPLALGQALLIALAGYLAWRLWGKTTAFFLTLLLALNPHLIAQARVYGTDGLLPVLIIISFLSLWLWQKTNANRYLFLSGFASAAAVLSKLPGLIIVPLLLIAIALYLIPQKGTVKHKIQNTIYKTLLWLLAFLVGAILILPSLAITPAAVIDNILETFRSEGYTTLHAYGSNYYPRVLLFFSTPLELLSVFLIPVALLIHRRSKSSPPPTRHLLWLLATAAFFYLAMSLGDKKGYRYLVPVFSLLDVALAITVAWLITALVNRKVRRAATIALGIFAALFTIQLLDIINIYPHVLAYTNPITRNRIGEMQYGWGEGLDEAAAYLNAKPNASELTVASYYPNEFGHYFIGETKPAHQHDQNCDYVVIYRAMFGRGLNEWETDIINQYRRQTPEKIISYRNVPFVWIYNTTPPNPPAKP